MYHKIPTYEIIPEIISSVFIIFSIDLQSQKVNMWVKPLIDPFHTISKSILNLFKLM